ncbi:hypothetical protein [Microbacterium rhizophilus]|uniref:hypothetical protein n=1 Tax=Microbacterium rhizophilus TaxID=3138934 RepID=UPI0031EC869B
MTRRVEHLTTRVLPVLWHGRLSWLRIVLTLLYGERVLNTVRGWQDPAPALLHEGWVLGLVPQGLQDVFLGHPTAVAVVVLACAGLGVIGLATRPALLLLAVLGAFAISVEAGQGVFDHESSLATQVLAVLAFAPGTDLVSVDSAIRWWRRGRPDVWGWLAAPYRKWGVTLILVLVAITYTTSGLSKLRFGGLGWLNGETLGFYLRGFTAGSHVYIVGGGPATWRDDFGLQMYTYANPTFGHYPSGLVAGLADWIAHTPGALVAISVATVCLELSGFLALVPKLRSAFLVSAILMHTTIGALMGLDFTMYRVIDLFLIEWELLGIFAAWWLARRRGVPRDLRASSPLPERA